MLVAFMNLQVIYKVTRQTMVTLHLENCEIDHRRIWYIQKKGQKGVLLFLISTDFGTISHSAGKIHTFAHWKMDHEGGRRFSLEY